MRPALGVSPPSRSAQQSSIRFAPPDWAARADSTESTQISKAIDIKIAHTWPELQTIYSAILQARGVQTVHVPAKRWLPRHTAEQPGPDGAWTESRTAL